MNDKNTISDELLTKFLCGKTTPEESELVMAYMAESDENIEDLKNICAAIEMQKDMDAQPAHQKRERNHKRTIWMISSVAATVLIIVACYTIINITTHSHNGEPILAEVTDTIRQTATDSESIRYDTVNNLTNEEDKDSEKEFSPVLQQNQGKNYAGLTEKSGYCNMVIPKTTTYNVSSSQIYFDFNWSTDAQTSRFELFDSSHALIFQEETTEDYIKFKASEYRAYNVLSWKLTALYEDGNTKVNTGTIKFE